MNRRETLGALGSVMVGAFGLTLTGPASADVNHVDYSKEAYEAALKSGKPLLPDFYASW